MELRQHVVQYTVKLDNNCIIGSTCSSMTPFESHVNKYLQEISNTQVTFNVATCLHSSSWPKTPPLSHNVSVHFVLCFNIVNFILFFALWEINRFCLAIRWTYHSDIQTIISFGSIPITFKTIFWWFSVDW